MTVAMTKVEASVLGSAVDNSRGRSLIPASNYSLPELFGKINPQDKHFLKYVPDGFLSEEQKVAKKSAIQEDANRIAGYQKTDSITAPMPPKRADPNNLGPVPNQTVTPAAETAGAVPRQTVKEESNDWSTFVSNRAQALYDEVSSMEKGKRVSGALGYLLDHLDLDAENKADSYRQLKTALISKEPSVYEGISDYIYSLDAKDATLHTKNGLKKERVTEYIWNELDVDDGIKMILYKQQYPNYKKYDHDIVVYLTQRPDVSQAQMKNILLGLGALVTQDGYVKWDW